MFKAITLTFVGLVALASAYPDADKVASLDQMPDLSFGLYSGYVPIDGSSKQLHYMAALKKDSPTTSPNIIWFNGGPGCSSMLGFLQEHGPYKLDDGETTFTPNEYAWNNFANMFYIESPADVGFSLCPKKEECKWNDENTADDNLIAVLNLLQKFPELQNNDLYIAGESYAGIYVPKLASRLHDYITKNKDDPSKYKPNFKGFMVGNGVTSWQYDTNPAFIEMAYWHDLYDNDLYSKLKTCDFSYPGFNEPTPECQNYYNEFSNLVAGVNVYDVFGKCYQSSSFFELYGGSEFGLYRTGKEIKVYKKFFTASDYTPWVKRSYGTKNLKEIPPCVYGAPILTYLNSASVKTALHIDASAPAWDLCAFVDYTMSKAGSLDVYTTLKGLYRILKFSGDTDGAVPTLGTKKWIAELNWTVTEEWRPYYVIDEGGNKQLAGYVEVRDGGFTFATIHGAGHMAPQWKRPQTYHAISNWVQGKPL